MQDGVMVGHLFEVDTSCYFNETSSRKESVAACNVIRLILKCFNEGIIR